MNELRDVDFAKFIENVKRKTGIDLSMYKEQQMKRRLNTQRLKYGFRTFAEYFEAIDKDGKLFNEFLDRMTINVSEFFRNPEQWRILQTAVLPEILSRQRNIRSWSAACSTGEEPYSLALLLLANLNPHEIDILATDIDRAAIEKAEQGVYAYEALKSLPDKWVTQYFIKTDEGYIVSNKVKRCVRFQQHDLLADSYPAGMDLILCRNVVIYFTEEAKTEIYAKLSKSLKSGGVLFLGSTEQIFQPQRYQLEAIRPFFYRKIGS